jgi:hypothetical protein
MNRYFYLYITKSGSILYYPLDVPSSVSIRIWLLSYSGNWFGDLELTDWFPKWCFLEQSSG